MRKAKLWTKFKLVMGVTKSEEPIMRYVFENLIVAFGGINEASNVLDKCAMGELPPGASGRGDARDVAMAAHVKLSAEDHPGLRDVNRLLGRVLRGDVTADTVLPELQRLEQKEHGHDPA